MPLQEQIDQARSEIRTDGYSMSIGELISLYENDEIDIHPEFQRFFRWSPVQKSRLIESIFLGIPIPQIFVAQRQDGIWDVVDGVQRLSTIFQLVGILKDEDGKALPPLCLEATQYLPDLAGKVWENPDDVENSLSQQQRLLIKRSKIDISIILKESDESSKYELFQRLNTGGSPLSPQEVRNAILVMLNRNFYQWLRKLANDQNFQECLSLTDRAIEEQYDMELVLRFIIFRTIDIESLRNIGDLSDFLSRKMIEIARDRNFNFDKEEHAFRNTFSFLNSLLGSDSLKKFDNQRERFIGGFLVSGYEVIALGIGSNIEHYNQPSEKVKEKIKSVWVNPEFISSTGSGIRASTRIPITISTGRELFANEEA
jgi:hypothetical protein